MPSLAIRLEGKVTGTARLEKDETILGRRDDCDVVIPDVNASRTHARIVRDGDGYVVEDQGSHNGITVNGARVERHVLADGDRIGIGSHYIDFYLSDNPPVEDAGGSVVGEDVSGRGVRTFDEGADGELGDMLRGMLSQAQKSTSGDRTMAMGESPLKGVLKDKPSVSGGEGEGRPREADAAADAGDDKGDATTGRKLPVAMIAGLVLLLLAIIILAIIFAR